MESRRWNREKAQAHQHDEMTSQQLSHEQGGEEVMAGCMLAMLVSITSVCILCHAGFVVERELDL